MINSTFFRCVILIFCCHLVANADNTASQPNIVFIMVDDLGYSDISCFGSEMATPNIDKLAEGGARFNHFYASPMCVTTRVAFLSGIEFKAAGNSNFPKGLCVAQLLREAGYATSWAGKNHGLEKMVVGNAATDYGFDHFFGFGGGQINSFTGAGNVKWQYDGTIFPNTDLPSDFYATEAFTDYAMQFMKEAIDDDKPFFSFVAYNAPHTPLNAPEHNVRKYYDPTNGVNAFSKGWNVLRQERFDRMKTMGILDDSYSLSDLGVEVPLWDLLPQTSSNSWDLQKNFECLSRSAYAGMVDNVDENVGRIMSFLEDPNNDGDKSDSELDNTLIVFVSDNGGCYAGSYTSRAALPWSRTNGNFTNNYGWGSLSNTPFRYYKHASHEGALRTPLIVHWPEGIQLPKNSINDEMLRVWDFYPTLLEAAGTNYDTPRSGLKPVMGKSFMPLLNGEEFEEDNYFVSAYNRTRGLIRDNYKITSYWDSPYELYDLSTDPTECIDLSASEPDLYAELIQEWKHYATTHGFVNDNAWNMPVGTTTRGWGYDFKHSCLESTVPDYMCGDAAVDAKLSLTFTGLISFSGTTGKKIRLQKYGDPTIIWSADPELGHACQGKKTLVFDDFPVLEPNTHYYITWDAGFVKYFNSNNALTSIPAVRESAYAYRFRTAAAAGVESAGAKSEDIAIIYPNPSSSQVTIKSLSTSQVQCYDSNARKMLDWTTASTLHHIDVSLWQAGEYFFKVKKDNKVCSLSLLVK